MQLNPALSTQENNETIECNSSVLQEDPIVILLYNVPDSLRTHYCKVKLENGSASISF